MADAQGGWGDNSGSIKVTASHKRHAAGEQCYSGHVVKFCHSGSAALFSSLTRYGVPKRKNGNMLRKLVLGLALAGGAALPLAGLAEAAVVDVVVASPVGFQMLPIEKAQWHNGSWEYCKHRYSGGYYRCWKGGRAGRHYNKHLGHRRSGHTGGGDQMHILSHSSGSHTFNETR
jgi:hypothetical protein